MMSFSKEKYGSLYIWFAILPTLNILSVKYKMTYLTQKNTYPINNNNNNNKTHS